MAERKITPQEFIKDMKTGMDNMALLKKYQISAKTLQRLFKQLLDAKLITRDDLNDRIFRCSTCGWSTLLIKKFEKCPKCEALVLPPEPDTTTERFPKSQIPSPVQTNPHKSPQTQKTGQEYKNCPYCDEQILKSAKKCNYCGKFLEKFSPSIQSHEEKTEKTLKEKFLCVVNSLLSIGFAGLAVVLAVTTWKASLVWLGLAVFFSPQMKTFLIQKLKCHPQKILLPKLLALLLGMIASLVFIGYEMEARELAKQAEIQAQFEAEKQAFLENRLLHINNLKELLAQGKYEDVITLGEPNKKFDQEVENIMENAQKLQDEREQKAQVAQMSQQIRQFIILQKYEDAYQVVNSFQGAPESRVLLEEALNAHIKNEEERLLSRVARIPESRVSSLMNVYDRLVKLVPTNQNYKTKLALYEYKVRKEQQEAKIREGRQKKSKTAAMSIQQPAAVPTKIPTAKPINLSTSISSKKISELSETTRKLIYRELEMAEDRAMKESGYNALTVEDIFQRHLQEIAKKHNLTVEEVQHILIEGRAYTW